MFQMHGCLLSEIRDKQLLNRSTAVRNPPILGTKGRISNGPRVFHVNGIHKSNEPFCCHGDVGLLHYSSVLLL